jgi:hypothetical protein
MYRMLLCSEFKIQAEARGKELRLSFTPAHPVGDTTPILVTFTHGLVRFNRVVASISKARRFAKIVETALSGFSHLAFSLSQVGGWLWTPTSQVPNYAHLMFHSSTHMLRFVQKNPFVSGRTHH